MKLTVENFGPIRKAEVVVGPMTVFVGPSNTGKSYLAILIYSVMKALSAVAETRSLFYGAAWPLVDEMKTELKSEGWYKNKRTVAQLVDKLFHHWVGLVTSAWKNQVLYCFGEEGENMIKGVENLVVKIADAQGNLEFDLHAHVTSKEHNAQGKLLSRYKNEFFALLQENSLGNPRLKDLIKERAHLGSLVIHSPAQHEEYRDILESMNRSIIATIAEKLYLQWFSMMHATSTAHTGAGKSYYLPAVRGGIMQSHRTLVSALIQRAPMAGLSAITAIPPFNGVLSDFMDQLLHIRRKVPVRTRRVTGEYTRHVSIFDRKRIQKIGGEVEEKIMQGQIDVQMSDLDYPDFRYTFRIDGKKHDLPLMSVSSMVSELAPVSLFIHHYISIGDLFIVEEPEAHLHPAAQRHIAGILVQLVNAGVRVLITTHSDVMLEQLGNYVQAAEIGKKVQKQSLAKDKISAYWFDHPKSGKQKNTKVKKSEFRPETGFLTKDHLSVSTSLYNEVVSLLNGEKNHDQD